MEIKVSLDDPDVELFVEVREKEAFLYSSVLPGPGGMPKGTQGRLLSIVESLRGVAATWLMMKRGCNVTVALENEGFGAALSRWDPDLKTVPFEQDMFAQARSLDCLGVALEWDIEDFEKGEAPKGDLPVFYPLVGMNRDEVGALLERLGR
jgi:thiamine biosynthesis protein ThiI